jgi:hypothetical protein
MKGVEFVKTPREEWDPAPAGKDPDSWRRCQEELDVDTIKQNHTRFIDCFVEGEQVGGHSFPLIHNTISLILTMIFLYGEPYVYSSRKKLEIRFYKYLIELI